MTDCTAGTVEEETMRDAVICNPLRTPIGRFGGMFRHEPVTRLGTTVLQALLAHSELPPADIDDVLLGQCYPNGEAPALGRVVAMDSGLPVDTAGLQLDRRCGSGLQTICMATMMVQTGAAEVVVAGGAESMSQAEYYTTDVRWGPPPKGIRLVDRLARARVSAGGERHPVPGGMIETAENVRRRYGISREEQDELALRSHERAVAAIDDGRFAKEIVPVPLGGGGDAIARVDEHPRRNSTLEALAKLRPVMLDRDPDATVTAGNASGQNDAASLCVVTTPERARQYGLRVMGVLRSWAVAGVEPGMMGLGPVPASARALERAELRLADMDLIELNEAFAAQVLGVTREWGFEDRDFDRLNVNGSGISLGHPVGATGCRLTTTLLHEMHRRGDEWGLETLCIGGGQGIAAVLQSVD